MEKSTKSKVMTGIWVAVVCIVLALTAMGIYGASPVAEIQKKICPEKTVEVAPVVTPVVAPCDCKKKKQASDHKKRKQKPILVRNDKPVVSPPVVAPAAAAPVDESKQLLAKVDPNFNRRTFVPTPEKEAPPKVIVVTRTVDITYPTHRHTGTGYMGNFFPYYTYGGYVPTPSTYVAPAPVIVPAPSVTTPPPSIVTNPVAPPPPPGMVTR